jgi:hypothetical protein
MRVKPQFPRMSAPEAQLLRVQLLALVAALPAARQAEPQSALVFLLMKERSLTVQARQWFLRRVRQAERSPLWRVSSPERELPALPPLAELQPTGSEALLAGQVAAGAQLFPSAELWP